MEELKYHCENNNFNVSRCISSGIRVLINKRKNKLFIVVLDHGNKNIGLLTNNLPAHTQSLTIDVGKESSTSSLENMFSNLPMTLKQIKFVYKNTRTTDIKNDEMTGRFNPLFCIKIPFNCDLMLNYGEENYHVKYVDTQKELELWKNIKMFNIKYVTEKFQEQNHTPNLNSSGIMTQLCAYGAMDSILTSNPQLTFYKFGYKSLDANYQKNLSNDKKNKFTDSTMCQKKLLNTYNKKVKTSHR
jgi:hypothetical protein